MTSPPAVPASASSAGNQQVSPNGPDPKANAVTPKVPAAKAIQDDVRTGGSLPSAHQGTQVRQPL